MSDPAWAILYWLFLFDKYNDLPILSLSEQ